METRKDMLVPQEFSPIWNLPEALFPRVGGPRKIDAFTLHLKQFEVSLQDFVQFNHVNSF